MRTMVEKSWGELSSLWNELYDANTCLTPYQSYDFLTYTGKGKPQRKNPFRLVGVRELNLVLYKDDKAIAIAPLLIKKKNKKFVVYLRGHFTTAYNLDFIYRPDWSYDDFLFLLNGIREMLGNASFYFDRITDVSVTCGHMEKYFSVEQTYKCECISIPVPETYDDWLGSLHKSTRRNITKYRNRLKREGVDYRVDFICGRAVDGATCKKMMTVYASRFLVKNNINLGPLKGLVIRILRAILLRDKITRYLNGSERNFHAVLYLNKKVAAFTSGLRCKDKRIAFSRLAIDTEYARYGPGGLLINAAVQYIVAQNNEGKLDIREMDMAQGASGGSSYKYAYGGKDHYTFDFSD